MAFNEYSLNVLHMSLVDGDTSGADISITGLAEEDVILGVMGFKDTTVISASFEAAYQSAGKMRTTTDSSGYKLWVLHYDISDCA